MSPGQRARATFRASASSSASSRSSLAQVREEGNPLNPRGLEADDLCGTTDLVSESFGALLLVGDQGYPDRSGIQRIWDIPSQDLQPYVSRNPWEESQFYLSWTEELKSQIPWSPWEEPLSYISRTPWEELQSYISWSHYQKPQPVSCRKSLGVHTLWIPKEEPQPYMTWKPREKLKSETPWNSKEEPQPYI
eukprot:gene24195-9793_t